MKTNWRFALACTLHNEGFSVIPIIKKSKRPARKWKQFQSRLASLNELRRWFVDNDFVPAIVTGKLSGITVIDCDNTDAIEAAKDAGYQSRVQQRTTRGIHLVFRHDGERNTVRVNGIQGIDRRGQGGYVLAYADSMCWTRKSIDAAPFLSQYKGE